MLAGARKRGPWDLLAMQLRERWRICCGMRRRNSLAPGATAPVAFRPLSAAEVTQIATVGGGFGFDGHAGDCCAWTVREKVLGVFHKAGAPAGALSRGIFRRWKMRMTWRCTRATGAFSATIRRR